MTNVEFSATAEILVSSGLVCSEPVAEPESAGYAACSFSVNGRPARFRVAKTTPTKAGQFVTLWLRSEAGPIRPFDVADGVELVTVVVADGLREGQFVFTAAALREHGILSADGAGGKRAFRVYPPSLRGLNAQATRAQGWQSAFFVETDPAREIDSTRIHALYGKLDATELRRARRP